MGNGQTPAQTVRIQKSARPWSGFLLGAILGISVALIVQQAGIWPLDKLALFGAAGLFSMIGIFMASAGRDRSGAFNTIVPLVLAVALLGWGATGIAEINETGEINGGCTVEATSSVDSTVVTDTSRQEPFQVDPDGSLSWVAASPAPITNHFGRSTSNLAASRWSLPPMTTRSRTSTRTPRTPAMSPTSRPMSPKCPMPPASSSTAFSR